LELEPPPVVVLLEGAFLVLFLWFFLVAVAVLLLLVLLAVLEPLDGGFWAGGVLCAAKATVVATAKAIAIRLFFIFLFSLAGLFSARLTVSSCVVAVWISIACRG
jgi:hypothetical protein